MHPGAVKASSTQNPPPDADDATCEICGGRTVEKHCKIQCLNCGYTRDCSDP